MKRDKRRRTRGRKTTRRTTPRRPPAAGDRAAPEYAGLFSAARAGADAALLSPVFWTASHPLAPALGPLRFAAWCRSSPLPVAP